MTTRSGMSANLFRLSIAAVIFAAATSIQLNAQATTSHLDDRSARAQRLARRLLGIDEAARDEMSRIMNEMKSVERRLSRSFDPGAQTQELQRRIVDDLDKAIAAAIRRGSGGSPAAASSDTRRAGQTRPTRPTSPRPGIQPGTQPAPSNSPVDENESRRHDALRESRRGWGHLPPRDREEILQSMNEESIEKFRDWIEQYYRALSEGEGP